MHSSADELSELRAELQRLREEVDELRNAASGQGPEAEATGESGERFDRRRMFKRAGLLTAGAVTGSLVAGAAPAGAADPNDIVKGSVNTTTARTDLRYNGGTDLNENILTVQDSTFGATPRAAAIAGWAAPGAGVTNGVYGWSNDRVDNNIDTGHALIGYRQGGGRSHLYLKPSGGAPQGDSYAHTTGEQRMDASGNLWLCTSAIPSPSGTWRKLSGPTASGSLHLLATPIRAYDSRPSGGGAGPIGEGAAGEETIDFNAVPGVPDNVTGVLCNLTVVIPAKSGWLAMWRDGPPWPGHTNLNYPKGVIVGNNATTAVDANGVARIRSDAETNYVVDLFGYYL